MAVTELPRYLLPSQIKEAKPPSQSEIEDYAREIRDIIFWRATNSLDEPRAFKGIFERVKGEMLGKIKRLGFDHELGLLENLSVKTMLDVASEDLEKEARKLEGVNPDREKDVVMEVTRLMAVKEFLERVVSTET